MKSKAICLAFLFGVIIIDTLNLLFIYNMTNLHIRIAQRLKFIQDFLYHAEKDVFNEWVELENRNQNGEFEEYGDYEAAMDFPLFREKFSTRAVVNELNALIEEILHTKADIVWIEKHKDKINIPKPIWEQQIGIIWELIEKYYGIRRYDLSNWSVYENLRDRANAYKHRQSFKKFSDIIDEDGSISQDIQYQATFENTKSLIEDIQPFMKNIWELQQK